MVCVYHLSGRSLKIGVMHNMDMLEAQNMAIFLTKHADKVLALINAGFFDLRNGHMIINIDNLGIIRKIEKHIVYTA